MELVGCGGVDEGGVGGSGGEGDDGVSGGGGRRARSAGVRRGVVAGPG